MGLAKRSNPDYLFIQQVLLQSTKVSTTKRKHTLKGIMGTSDKG